MSADSKRHDASGIRSRGSYGSRPGQSGFVRANIDLLEDFPFDLGETFAHHDLPEQLQNSFFKNLRSQSLIRKSGRTHHSGRDVYEYTLTEVAVDLIDHYTVDDEEDDRIRGPCGHLGIKNLGDGWYSCSREECDAQFGREVAKEVLGRQ